jgi:small-conductance mechanosensitive channel
MGFFDSRYFGNSLEAWAIALGFAVALYTALALTRKIAKSRLLAYQASTTMLWPGVLHALVASTRYTFLQIASFYYATEILVLPPRTAQIIGKIAFLGLLVQLALWGTAVIRHWVDRDLETKGSTDGARAQSMRAIGFLSCLVLYCVIVLWGLDNFGVNITALVAGLGVGGIAVALAVQNILGDLFASLTIVLDKPFVYGDFIVVGEFKGTIEHVGLKTTRVRSLSGEQLIFPNADLLQSRIRNFKRMAERRVSFTLNVAQNTPLAHLKQLPGQIRAVIASQPGVRFERSHLLTLTASSIDIETVYWMLDPDFTKHADTLQRVNLAVLELFETHGIGFAATQTVGIKSMPIVHG